MSETYTTLREPGRRAAADRRGRPADRPLHAGARSTTAAAPACGARRRGVRGGATPARGVLRGRAQRVRPAARAAGTPFQQRVWAELQRIGYGETITTPSSRRASAGRPAIRAAGAANGANPVSIVIPCHRVIGSDGTLTGYGGGLEAKRFLLDLERAGA